MKIWRAEEEKAEQYLRRLESRLSEVVSPKVEEEVRAVVRAVERKGDAALTRFVRRFDLAGMAMPDLRLAASATEEEAVEEEFVEAVELALANLQAFHEPQKPKGYTVELQGDELAIRVRPLDSVGVYVPGGQAVYLSSLLMAVVPARIAGVERIAVATPPKAYLGSPHLRYVLGRLGLREVYLMGGAHGVAALALGTESVVPVDKVVGPGGRWVTAAKRVLFGRVDIDLLAGPTELVVVADAHADPQVVAADLLAQAEHDPDALALLVTTSEELAEAVVKGMKASLRGVPKGAAVRQSLSKWGAVLVVRRLEDAAALVNRVAPEHVELLVEEPRPLADRIHAAGALFLGSFSPTALGDYCVGSNHILPTGGSARFGSPLGVWDFVRRTAVVKVAPHRYRKLALAAQTLAGIERLPFHAESLAAGERRRL